MDDAEAQIPTVVELEHGFFKAFSDPYFKISAPPEEKPVMCANLGDQEVLLSISGIIRELELEEDDPHRLMLEMIAKSLQFVTALRPGDQIPAEVLTGEASWDAEAAHLDIARQRLTMQLVTWVSGRETMITDPIELQQLFEDPSTKQKITDAFSEAAGRLGVAGHEEVANMVEDFAVELSYVEALRERFVKIQDLFKTMNVLRKNYHDQNSIIDEIDPVIRLMKKPVSDFKTNFDLIDAQTGEIMTVLSKLDVQRDYVRGLRNDLYVRFEAWNEIVDQWDGVDPLYPQDFNIANGLRDLYQFLAQRYMAADEWVLMAGLKDEGGPQNRYGGVMTW